MYCAFSQRSVEGSKCALLEYLRIVSGFVRRIFAVGDVTLHFSIVTLKKHLCYSVVLLLSRGVTLQRRAVALENAVLQRLGCIMSVMLRRLVTLRNVMLQRRAVNECYVTTSCCYFNECYVTTSCYYCKECYVTA